ncbi:hypothetical protein GRJ2_000974400 [Grus japonensis]|uniref:Uncharacterized protein n=1 Tax=Grus japonensis TaxID=30415 RepID=A0ABC9WIM2_GRUJA
MDKVRKERHKVLPKVIGRVSEIKRLVVNLSGHLYGMFPAGTLTRGLLHNDFWLVLHTSLLFGLTQHSLMLLKGRRKRGL